MKTLNLAAAVLVVAAVAGCATEQTRRIADGEDTEVTSGFAEADLRIVVSKAVQGINQASMRYAKPDARRIVNVKPFTVDTTARGSQAGYLADSLKMMFEEALMGWDGEFHRVQRGFCVADWNGGCAPGIHHDRQVA